MTVKDEYLFFRDSNGLKTNKFKDRVLLQNFLRDRLEKIWDEKPNFSNGGLLSNYMTQYAIGFAYYDCRPSNFCQDRCYGLPLSGLHDYYMLRLGVITSESFKTRDERFINIIKEKINILKLKCLKIGHWGDATLEQVPVILELVKEFPETIFWWYTRKIEVAIAVNEYSLPNIKAYLSIDPSTKFPNNEEYPYGITYLLSQGIYHKEHDNIIKDHRLVAIFPLKKGKFIESLNDYGLMSHPKLCKEKRRKAELGTKADEICLSCSGCCNYSI